MYTYNHKLLSCTWSRYSVDRHSRYLVIHYSNKIRSTARNYFLNSRACRAGLLKPACLLHRCRVVQIFVSVLLKMCYELQTTRIANAEPLHIDTLTCLKWAPSHTLLHLFRRANKLKLSVLKIKGDSSQMLQ
jgi:hypothetical protein